jgi:hypothetical protein
MGSVFTEVDTRRNNICKMQIVFKIKRNRIFRARLVACRYSQVPGIVFIESYAPVINDASLRIILIGMIVWNLKANIIDIESSFLYDGLDERIFMEIPIGMVVGNGKCLFLRKKIFGFVQSVRY